MSAYEQIHVENTASAMCQLNKAEWGWSLKVSWKRPLNQIQRRWDMLISLEGLGGHSVWGIKAE